jgi:SNF2 family DNA or RNA helicase
MIYRPYEYQKYATEHIISNTFSALFLDMGMGKTVCTLTAVNDLLYDYFDVAKVLVIAPLRVAQHTWNSEAEKWQHLSHLKISQILGSEKQRIAAINKKADIYIINRENLDWLVGRYENTWCFDMVVIDELSSFKSAASVRFKALNKVRPYIKRLVGLTGTPAPNGLIDLWPQIYLLDGGERLEKSLNSYRYKYFYPGRSFGAGTNKWILARGAEKAIHGKIKDICISMSAKDYLDLPERIDNLVKVKLPKEAEKKYRQLEEDLAIVLKDSEIAAVNGAVLTNKLLQMTSGAVYDENSEVKEVHEEKLKALENILEEANGKPLLVFYGYRHEYSRILDYLTKEGYKARGLQTTKDIEDWNKGEIPVLLVHPASAGHGLNLQSGGNLIAWFSLPWSLELYEQANARLHRQGQKEKVIIHHILAENTIDEDVMRVLTRKERNQNKLLEAVKARIMPKLKEATSQLVNSEIYEN